MELFNGTVIAWLAFRDEEHCYLETQAKADAPTERTGRYTPATEFSTIIELHQVLYAQMLPSVHQEFSHGVTTAAGNELDVNGLVKGIFTNQKVRARAITF
jgi:hypothetical protein